MQNISSIALVTGILLFGVATSEVVLPIASGYNIASSTTLLNTTSYLSPVFAIRPSEAIDLPFTIRFQGQNYSRIYFCRYGYVTFNSSICKYFDVEEIHSPKIIV